MRSDEIIAKINEKLKTIDSNNRTILNIFQFHFTDGDGKLIKSMVFDFKALSIYEGTTANADGEITIADEDFYLIGSKQLSFDEVLAADKAQLKGDTEAIKKMLLKFSSSAKK